MNFNIENFIYPTTCKVGYQADIQWQIKKYN